MTSQMNKQETDISSAAELEQDISDEVGDELYCRPKIL